MNDPTNGGAGSAEDLFSQLSPEQLSALLQGGTLQDKGGLLAQQLQDLLAQPDGHVEHSTPLGAGLGGIADVLNGTANAFHVKALRGQQQQNVDAQGKLMSDFGQLLRRPQAAAAAPAQAPQATPGLGMDLSGPTGEQGITSFPTPTTQTPIPPAAQQGEIVDNGSDGWGMDLSGKGQVEHMLKALRGKMPADQTAMSPEWGIDLTQPQLASIPSRRGGRRGPFDL